MQQATLLCVQKRVDACLKSQNASIQAFLSDAHAQLKLHCTTVLDISGRPKNLASIYRKLQSPKRDGKGPRVCFRFTSSSVTFMLPSHIDCVCVQDFDIFDLNLITCLLCGTLAIHY